MNIPTGGLLVGGLTKTWTSDGLEVWFALSVTLNTNVYNPSSKLDSLGYGVRVS